jgi:hypothetical protein
MKNALSVGLHGSTLRQKARRKMSKRICLNCKCTKIRKDKYIEDGSDCFVCTDCCRIGTAKEFPEMTVFHAITVSPEVLAPRFVYNRFYMKYEGQLSYWVSSYFSTIIPGKSWEYETEAIVATVARLKEVEK